LFGNGVHLVLLYAEDDVLTALAQARDAVLLAGEFVTELKVEFPAANALATGLGDRWAATKQRERHFLFGVF